VVNTTVQLDTGDYRFLHLIADDSRGRLVATYHDTIGGTSSMVLLDLDGNRSWGPVTKTSGQPWEPYLSPNGTLYLVWANGSRVVTSVFDQNMTLVRDAAVVVNAGGSVLLPQVVDDGAGHLMFAYLVDDGSGNEPWLSIVAADTFAPIAPSAPADTGGTAATRPRVVATGDRQGWFLWHREGTSGPTTEVIQASRFDVREVGFNLAGSQQELSGYRGENFTLHARLTNTARDSANFALTTGFRLPRGPANWTRQLVDASTGLPVTSLALGPSASVDLEMRVAPPLVDPAGYGVFVFLNASSTDVTGRSVELTWNLTVLAGRSFAFSPASQNFTVLPGDQAQIYFAVRNTGELPEDGAPLRIGLAPPPGWNATLSRNNITALPGEVVAVSLVVRASPTSLSTDTYCTVVRVESLYDPFTLATGSFCVRTALIAAPLVAPLDRVVDISGGETVPVQWTLENVGNAAAPLACHLAVVDALPSGWFVLGNPASVDLARNTAGNVTLSFTAPDGALGNFSQLLLIRGSCDGYGGTIDGTVRVSVRAVHDVFWRSPGTTATTDLSGLATFVVTAENRGNMVEPLGFAPPTLPGGWSAAVSWTVAGAPASAVLPGETATGRLAVQAKEGTGAFSYPVSATFTSGGGDYTGQYTVRVPATYGLGATFSPSEAEAAPGEVVSLSVEVVHAANTLDTYSLQVTVPNGWDWESDFVSDPGAPPALLNGTTLRLDALARGTLYLYVSVPLAAVPRDFTVGISLVSSNGPRAEHNATLTVVAPDLSVRIDALPNGTADPTLVSDISFTVLCAGPRPVANTTVEVWVDGARAFESPVGPLCPPGSASFTFTLSLGPGNHTVEAIVDPLTGSGSGAARGLVAEADEDNNRASAGFEVAQAPPDDNTPPDGEPNTPAASADFSLLVILMSAVAGAAVAVFALLRSRRAPPAAEPAAGDVNELL
jgi:hypothetical protein